MKNTLLLLILSFFSSICIAQNPYDVTAKKNVEESSDEKSEIVKQFDYLHMSNWEKGMRFMVLPDNLEINNKLELVPYKSKQKYSSQLKQKEFEWKIFTFQRIEERKARCGNSRCKKAYVIFECEGKEYEYEFIGGNKEEMKESKAFTNIKEFVYLDEVDKAKKLLLDTTLFVLTNQWMRENKDGHGVYDFNNPKFIPVKITKIGLGNQDGPVRIIFKGNQVDEAYIDVRFSGTNLGYGISGFEFDEVFTTDNPRNKYPNIDDEIWKIIQQSEVKKGMTKNECELSWGKPTDINKTISDADVTEQWVYGNSYLYFKNGILSTIQN